MLHGYNSNGPEFVSEGAQMYMFQGIVACPTETASGMNSWPTSSQNWHWAPNLQMINTLIAMPEVDSSRVYIAGYSNGGFFTYALTCAIGSRLRAVGVLAGMMEIQPSCPYRTNVIHLHNANDNMNTPMEYPGSNQHNTPLELRTAWLEGATDPATNGAAGVTTGPFTLYSATQGALTYEYWSYAGPSEHSYMVYQGTPAGCPQGDTQEEYMVTFFLAAPPLPVQPSPPSAFQSTALQSLSVGGTPSALTTEQASSLGAVLLIVVSVAILILILVPLRLYMLVRMKRAKKEADAAAGGSGVDPFKSAPQTEDAAAQALWNKTSASAGIQELASPSTPKSARGTAYEAQFEMLHRAESGERF